MLCLNCMLCCAYVEGSSLRTRRPLAFCPHTEYDITLLSWLFYKRRRQFLGFTSTFITLFIHSILSFAESRIFVNMCIAKKLACATSCCTAAAGLVYFTVFYRIKESGVTFPNTWNTTVKLTWNTKRSVQIHGSLVGILCFTSNKFMASHGWWSLRFRFQARHRSKLGHFITREHSISSTFMDFPWFRSMLRTSLKERAKLPSSDETSRTGSA